MIPPTRVLAAVDFSEASRTAFACAARLAHQFAAELHVLYAEETLLATAARSRGVDLAAEALEELRSSCPAHCPAASCAPRYHVIVGDAVDTILAIAQRESSSVVVVGARGMSGAERLVFGSTTEGLLRRANLSVLVVPESWKPPRAEAPDLSGTGPVIAGIDMTCPSIEAAAAAVRLAVRLKSEAILLHVVPELHVPERWRTHADTARRDRIEQSRRDLERVVKGIEAIGPVRLHIETGSIPHRLAEAASPHAMLILGRALRAHGYGPPGAIAYRVLTLARVPVLMHIPA